MATRSDGRLTCGRSRCAAMMSTLLFDIAAEVFPESVGAPMDRPIHSVAADEAVRRPCAVDEAQGAVGAPKSLPPCDEASGDGRAGTRRLVQAISPYKSTLLHFGSRV